MATFLFGPHRPRFLGFPALFSVLLPALWLAGCASRTVDDYSPEVSRDPSGAAIPVVVELKDLRSAPPAVFLLSNLSGTRALKRSLGGKLPRVHKEVADDRMGQLLAYMRYEGFHSYASPAGNPPARLPTGARRTLSLWEGNRPMVRMIDVRGMGSAGRKAEVQAISRISLAVQQISNETLSLKVDPTGRTGQDFLNQPGLRRGTGGR